MRNLLTREILFGANGAEVLLLILCATLLLIGGC